MTTTVAAAGGIYAGRQIASTTAPVPPGFASTVLASIVAAAFSPKVGAKSLGTWTPPVFALRPVVAAPLPVTGGSGSSAPSAYAIG